MSIKFITFVLVIVSIFNGARPQVSKIGMCPKKAKPMDKLKLEKFVGKWYEIEHYPLPLIMGPCVTIDYQLTKKGGATITTSQVVPGMNTTSSQSSVATGDGTTFTMTVGLISDEATLTILDTDYENYAVVFSCAEFFQFSSIHYAWILSRNRTLSAEFKAKAIQAFTKAEVDTAPLMATDQMSCKNETAKASVKEEKKSVKASEKSEKKSGKTTKKQDKTTPKSSGTTAKKSDKATTKKKN